jgi:hypothetical protein
VRNSAAVRHHLYPRLVRVVYDTDRLYITADERKMSEKDVDKVLSYLSDPKIDYFKPVRSRSAE